VDDLLLERPEQAFDDAVGLGLADEGVTGRQAPEADLFLEVVGHEGAAMVVADGDAARCVLGQVAELGPDSHAQGVDGLRPPSLTTGPSTSSEISVFFM
jgi:hypothetical protein